MAKKTIRAGFAGKVETKDVEIAAGDPIPWDPSQEFSLLGKRTPRLDGKAKTTGAARYSIDTRLPGMLYGKILRSPRAAAVVRSIDLGAAKKLPGVRAAIAIAEPGAKLRFAGQEVAAVARIPPSALDALAAIRVSTRRPASSCEWRRQEEGPPGLRGEGRSEERRVRSSDRTKPSPERETSRDRGFRRRKPRRGLSPADVVVEGTYGRRSDTLALETTDSSRSGGGRADRLGLDPGDLFGGEELAEALSPPRRGPRDHRYMGGGFGAKFGAR